MRRRETLELNGSLQMQESRGALKSRRDAEELGLQRQRSEGGLERAGLPPHIGRISASGAASTRTENGARGQSHRERIT